MYGKLFLQMFDGTLATKGPWQALVTFQQLIILADRYGTVDMTLEAISRRTTIPLDVIEIGIRELEKPDSASRSPDEEGRRIVRLSENRAWGWRIVNHAHYRRIRSEEERREYHKLYQRKLRATKGVNRGVNMSTTRDPNQPRAVGNKHDALRSTQSPHATRGGGDLQARGMKVFGEIVAHKVTTPSPRGVRVHIPKELVEALPAPARVALDAIGGAAAIAEAIEKDDQIGIRTLRSQFARVYASECAE